MRQEGAVVASVEVEAEVRHEVCNPTPRASPTATINDHEFEQVAVVFSSLTALRQQSLVWHLPDPPDIQER